MFYEHSTDTVDSYAAPETMDGQFPYSTNFQAPYNSFADITTNNPGVFTYNPLIFGSYVNGETSEDSNAHSNTVGITPKLHIFLPHNTITIGGMLAKESGDSGSAVSSEYFYGTTNMPEVNGYDRERCLAPSYCSRRITQQPLFLPSSRK